MIFCNKDGGTVETGEFKLPSAIPVTDKLGTSDIVGRVEQSVEAVTGCQDRRGSRH
jgi:hypothetical protein